MFARRSDSLCLLEGVIVNVCYLHVINILLIL